MRNRLADPDGAKQEGRQLALIDRLRAGRLLIVLALAAALFVMFFAMFGLAMFVVAVLGFLGLRLAGCGLLMRIVSRRCAIRRGSR